MKPKYIQFDCREEDKVDLRQANAVLRYRPDIIILEYPNNSKTPDLPFNQYGALQKPHKMVEERLKRFPRKVLKIHPWAKSDEMMWRNIVGLWREDHQIMVYAVDGPNELTREWLDVWKYSYPCIKKNWLWWVQVYLRERIMANNIRWILHNYKEKESPVVLVFLQSFHWQNVRFLLENPGKKQIWNHYFAGFSEVNRSNIVLKIKDLNKIFYKYWQKVSDF